MFISKEELSGGTVDWLFGIFMMAKSADFNLADSRV
jgi:hypothetical protein